MACVGVVKFFVEAKHYGFLDTCFGDIYVNKENVKGKIPKKGDQVTFDIVEDEYYKKGKAINVETVTMRKGRYNSKGQFKSHRVLVYTTNHPLVLKRSKDKKAFGQ